MEVLHCAILLAVLLQARCEVPVQGLESVEVREGEEAILSCTTPSEILFCTFRSPTDETFTMKPGIPYEDGRIVFHGTDEKKECGLKITNVKEKDNGEWKCLLTAFVENQAKKGEDSAYITVAKAPNDIHIEVDDETTAAVIVNYPENKERKVKCVASGGRPAATFSWMLGEDQFNGPVQDLDSIETAGGTLTQSQVLTYHSEPSHNGKKLTCIVAHKGFAQEQISAQENRRSLTLDVQFKPVDAEKTQEFYNLAVGKQHTVLMNFRAHPRPTKLHWELYDGTTVNEGSESLDQRFYAEQLAEGPTDGYYTAKLDIKNVKAEDAGTTSNLVVTNELGTTNYKFSLHGGEKPASEAGSGPVIAIVIVAIIIIVVIVVAVIARSQGLLCFADKNIGDDGEKSAAQFEALEKGEASPEKEPIKESSDIKKEPEPTIENIVPNKSSTEDEKEEKKSNGSHTPV